MKPGQMFRYARPYDPKPSEIDGLPNFFHYTHTPGCRRCVLDRGINHIASVKGSDGHVRIPAILVCWSPLRNQIFSSLHEDMFDEQAGEIHYWGDNNRPNVDPQKSLGNRIFLFEYENYHSQNLVKRQKSAPLLFFKRISYGKRKKGHVVFLGCGYIDAFFLENSYVHDRSFQNYLFICKLISLSSNHNEFNWKWVNDRRDPNLSLEETNSNAPLQWKQNILDS